MLTIAKYIWSSCLTCSLTDLLSACVSINAWRAGVKYMYVFDRMCAAIVRAVIQEYSAFIWPFSVYVSL